ncbi:MAG: hypothetical protein JW795_12595 [Chitinivibrionales bacterium]|nr:hypothetical protein [Chitinivibrionales bacterium]
MAIAIGLLIVGYILLGQGPVTNHLSWSVAPVILVLVYLVLMPYAILYEPKQEQEPNQDSKKQNRGV